MGAVPIGAMVLAAVLAGCGSGGGGVSGGSTALPLTPPSSSIQSWSAPGTFTLQGSNTTASYSSTLPKSIVTYAIEPFPEVNVEVRYNTLEALQRLTVTPTGLAPIVFDVPGHSRSALASDPNIDVMLRSARGATTQFLPGAPHGFALVANPFALGWEYQSFGVWNDASRSVIAATSFGAVTPPDGVPLSGTANFTGKLAGFYVSSASKSNVASANVELRANFAERTLKFSSTGTQLSSSLNTFTAAPNLDLKGTLEYKQGSNAFTGTLTNGGNTMSGTSNGRFFGPTAEELGGTFQLRGPSEGFVGAYGARR